MLRGVDNKNILYPVLYVDLGLEVDIEPDVNNACWLRFWRSHRNIDERFGQEWIYDNVD